MPEPKYNYYDNNSYNDLYNQYYFNESKNSESPRPIRKKITTKKKNKKLNLRNFIKILFYSFLLFYVLPFSFNNFIADIFPLNTKNILRADYYKIMFPTHSYLYKDLFLGKYILKDTEYKKYLMVDINETSERIGLKNHLLELAKEYPKIKPSIYVWDYSTGSYVDIDANEMYPAASIIKVPILIEMFREIDQGKFTLDDRIVLDDYYRASGSGKLQYSQGGIAHTMDNLARIMIENSDNSATNMIMAKIGGMPEVNRAIKSWGLVTTRVNNWLPDLDGTNVTTAREMGKMFYNIDSTGILSATSKRQIADYLGHVKNNRLLQAGLPQEAILLHKTGDIGFMLGDAGIVKTSSGRKYIVVILARRPYNSSQGKEFIVKASEIIYKHMI